MNFYNEQGNEITRNAWITNYKRYYFLNGPTCGRNITRGNQSSVFIENAIIKLLMKGIDNFSDIKLLLGWKLGKIIHSRSTNSIIFENRWETNHKDKNIPYQPIMDYIIDNLQSLKSDKPQNIYKQMRKFFKTDVHVIPITIVFFLTKGKYPIYDRFAHKALVAIDKGIKPRTHLKIKSITCWNDYLDFIKMGQRIFKVETISRDIDQALWVYGHCFPDLKKNKAKKMKESSNAIYQVNINSSERAAQVCEHRQIVFRQYTAWERDMPKHNTELTIHFDKHWVRCQLGDKSKQYWTKQATNTSFGRITWQDFFQRISIQDQQKFKVRIINNDFYLTKI